MLKGKNLTNGFWEEAVNTAVYLKNRSPTKSLDYKTPFEALFGFKPAVSHLRLFRCKAFAHVPKEKKKELDSKAINCTFIGCCSEYKAYKIFDPSTHKVFVSRDVVFHEQVDDGNPVQNNEEWHVPLLLNEDSETRISQQQQKQQQQQEQ